jgi:acetyltransferase-like isoleucine patch superfamily enzyme
MGSKRGFITTLLFNFFQKLNGTARFEAESLPQVLHGILGRCLQWIAISFLPLPAAFRVFLQRLRGVKIGKHVFIGPGCWLDNTRPDLITIEDYVSLAGRVTVLTHSDPTLPLREILGPTSRVFKPVVIKRGAWVTVNCVVLPGVTIGENSIIAAGSVVNKDIPPNVVAGGIPARVIRSIESVGDAG